jgi:hypothetical protein
MKKITLIDVTDLICLWCGHLFSTLKNEKEIRIAPKGTLRVDRVRSLGKRVNLHRFRGFPEGTPLGQIHPVVFRSFSVGDRFRQEKINHPSNIWNNYKPWARQKIVQ